MAINALYCINAIMQKIKIIPTWQQIQKTPSDPLKRT